MSTAEAPKLFRLSPAHVLRLLGPVFVGLGLMWMLVALFGFSTTWARMATGVSLLVAVAGVIFALRPPVVLKLTDDGYRVSWVRGAGTAIAQWRQVTTFGTQHLGETLALVVELSEGRTTVVPMSLLGARGREAVLEIRQHLDAAHGQRRFGSD
jgi:hypothetical protein